MPKDIHQRDTAQQRSSRLLLAMGVDAKIVDKAGAWYSYDGERIGQGKENARQYLKENPAVAVRLETALRAQFVPAEIPRKEAEDAAEDD